MGIVRNLTGKKFGLLTVLSEGGRDNQGRKKWLCRCECGNRKTIASRHLIQGKTSTCGCKTGFEPTRPALGLTGHRHPKFKHGLSNDQEYIRWKSMISRCENPRDGGYYLYGGRGIKVCDRWQVFENFLQDMGRCPEGMSIDRIDVNGDYEPGNCRWVDRKTQANNTRRNKFLVLKNERRTIAQWSEITGLRYGLIIDRLRKGWSVERALTEPLNIKHSHPPRYINKLLGDE